LGRKPRKRWHEREIDIDLIFYNDLVLETDILTIPHKLMHKRNFVINPVAEIAAGFVHPVLGKSMEELSLGCEDDCAIRKL